MPELIENNELVLENAFDSLGQGPSELVCHVFLCSASPPPSFPLIHVPEMVEIDAGLVEDNNFTRRNTRTDLARPPVAVLGKEHGSQMAQNAEGASSGIHPSLTDILI